VQALIPGLKRPLVGGPFKHAISFGTDGADRSVFRTTQLPSITSFTIAFWARRESDTGNYEQIITFGPNDATSNYYALYIEPGDALTAWNSSGEVGGSAVAVNAWNHYAITVSGTGAGQFLTYVNGVLAITHSGSATPSAGRILFHQAPESLSFPFRGSFKEGIIYDRPLAADEISVLARNGGFHFRFRRGLNTYLSFGNPLNPGQAAYGQDFSVTTRVGYVRSRGPIISSAWPVPIAVPVEFKAASGGSVLDAAAAVTVGGVDGTAVGHAYASASAAHSIGGVTMTAAARGTASAASALTVGGVNATAAGSLVTDSAAALTVGGVDLTAVAHMTASALAAFTVGGVTMTAVGHGLASALAAFTVGGVDMTANATLAEPDIAAQVTVGGVDMTAVAHAYANASASFDVGGVTMAAVGHGLASAASAVTVGGVDITAAGAATMDSAAALTVGGVDMTAVAHAYASAQAVGTVGGVGLVAVASGLASAAAAVTVGGVNLTASAEGGESGNMADTTVVLVDHAKDTSTSDQTTVVIVDKAPEEEDNAQTTIVVQTDRND
jgi:hypothetical protein